MVSAPAYMPVAWRSPNFPKTAQRRRSPSAAASGTPNRVAIDRPTYPTLAVSTSATEPTASRVSCQSPVIRSMTTSRPSATIRAWYTAALSGAATRPP